jgi:hypothetical protein
MLLQEFFGKSLDLNTDKRKDQSTEKFDDDLFYFMLDHDKLHKDYFFPIAEKLKNKKAECEPDEVLKMFMPMVVKGCKEYYATEEMKGKLGKVFPKDLREELCKRLYDQYREDIKKDKYNLG